MALPPNLPISARSSTSTKRTTLTFFPIATLSITPKRNILKPGQIYLDIRSYMVRIIELDADKIQMKIGGSK